VFLARPGVTLAFWIIQNCSDDLARMGDTGFSLALSDPPQLTRLVVGCLPGASKELCPRDWALLLILKIVEPRHELGATKGLSIHHPEARARHRDDDIASPNFDFQIILVSHGSPGPARVKHTAGG
jgi:hypothetical protein